MKRIEAFGISMFMVAVGMFYATVVIDNIAVPQHVEPMSDVWWFLMTPAVLLIIIATAITLKAAFSPTKVGMTKEEWRRS